MLSDVSQTASTQSLLLYSGKRGELSGKTHTVKIEKSFMRGKFNKGHSLNMDSLQYIIVLNKLGNCYEIEPILLTP